ncbi:hypothetical protein JKP88DRAFT_260996 [Tribonema minus]|uniref:Uncharacterized protein n=1 Tax=Tribonema minus TaxID=303371 RepID=A0A836CIH8_9STRA|nr:hypothetical protein JKP88DRAFT_260996 [Tribonema minus]
MATAPDAWWTKVTPWTPSAYAPPSYSPGTAADINHRLFGAFRDNTFSNDSSSYNRGLAGGAGFFAALAVLLLLLFPITYCLLSSKRGEYPCGTLALVYYCRAKAKSPGKGCARAQFWAWWLVLLAGTVITLYGLIDFTMQISALGSDAGNVHNSLVLAQQSATDVSAASLNLKGAVTQAAGAVAACTGAAVPVAGATATLAAAAAAAATVSNNEDLQNVIDKTDNWSSRMEGTDWIRAIVIAIIAVLCVVFLLAFGALVLRTVARGKTGERGRCCSRCTTGTLVLLAVLLVLLGWVATGAVALMAMVGGDFCQDPNGNVLTLVPDNPIATYYLTCAGAETSVVTQALQTTQKQLLAFMTGISADFTAIAAAAPACAAAVSTQVNAISTSAYDLNTATVGALDATSCETINTAYVEGVQQTLCHDSNRALAFLLLGCFLLLPALMFVVLLWRLIDAQRRTGGAPVAARKTTSPRRQQVRYESPLLRHALSARALRSPRRRQMSWLYESTCFPSITTPLAGCRIACRDGVMLSIDVHTSAGQSSCALCPSITRCALRFPPAPAQPAPAYTTMATTGTAAARGGAPAHGGSSARHKGMDYDSSGGSDGIRASKRAGGHAMV